MVDPDLQGASIKNPNAYWQAEHKQQELGDPMMPDYHNKSTPKNMHPSNMMMSMYPGQNEYGHKDNMNWMYHQQMGSKM